MKGLDTLAPELINKTSKEVDKIAEARIKQVINDGGQQNQKIAPLIRRGAIEEVYKTLFRLLENFGKQKLPEIKKKILKLIKK